MRRHQGPPPRPLVLAFASLVLAVGVVAHAQSTGGITATGATVDKIGWWHIRNVATSTPAANVTVPPPPGVPAGTLAVGAQSGDADKIAAIGILPESNAGDTITTFTLVMKEAASPAVQANSSAAKINACPVTAFWVGGENGTWDARPQFSCDLAKAPGVRAADGTWTFDLTPIGQVWVDPFGTTAADGVVLVEDVASPETFQTVFATTIDGAITVTYQATAGASTGDGTGSTADTTPLDTSGGSLSIPIDTPSIGSSDIPIGGVPPPTAAPAATAGGGTASPAAKPIASSKPNVLGNLPGGLLLLVPVALALLALMSYSLGPAGEPVAATRERGVSRALAARERALADSHRPPETR